MVPCIYWDVEPCRPSPPSGESESRSVMPDSLQPYGPYSPWNSLGQNTGVGSLSLLQRIFLTQEPNRGLPHCRQILYQLSRKGSPRILERVAYPFSSSSSQPRNQTGVSCIASRFCIRRASPKPEGLSPGRYPLLRETQPSSSPLPQPQGSFQLQPPPRGPSLPWGDLLSRSEDPQLQPELLC